MSLGTFVKWRRRERPRRLGFRVVVLPVCAAVLAGFAAAASMGGSAAQAAPAPAGMGFSLNAADMRFILKQIKIAEHHAITETDPDGNPLFGTGPYQIASPLLPYGLRTVDGSYNNLVPGQSTFGAVQQKMPRVANPEWRDGEDLFPPFGSGHTSYTQKKGIVVDSRPRVISNLIVDQTASNPAAVKAAARPHRHFNPEPSAVPCAPDGTPTACTAAGDTLFIPNVTTDVGLSPPYNSWFTLFGQFFDHGLDLTAKSGGTVIVPLKPDDPLIPGPDGILNNDPATPGNEAADNLPPHLRFMALTRAQNQPGNDGILGDDPSTPLVDESADDEQNATNLDTSWVDQSQTYTSHSSHQVFLRQYALDAATGKPVATGQVLSPPQGGMADWATVKQQAATLLGIKLVDTDVLNVPMVLADQYGRFLRGPNGYPQLAMKDGSALEGNPADPIPTTNAKRIDIAFLDDIAHHAVPGGGKTPDSAGPGSTPDGTQDDRIASTYDDEMLDAHFIAGDGRVNENIGLTAIHQVFHSEHNRLVGYMENLITTQNVDVSEWQLRPGVWNGERIFQAARFVTEMEYQHLVFEEFARKIQPGINPFNVFTQSMTDINPAIKAEFAHAVYRFGHSMLTDTISRTAPDGTAYDIPLLDGFLNPPAYYDDGNGGSLNPEEAAGGIAMGMTDQVGNELDEFVADTLRNNLLGLPLDLPTINMTRARSEGIPSLNNFRRQVFTKTLDSAMQPYTSWVDFGLSIKHQDSVVNFMAAYGTHPTILAEDTIVGKRTAAQRIFDGDPSVPDAFDFVNSDGAWVNNADGSSATGLDDVDLWVGGLAEQQNLFGGLLGSTMNFVFEGQMQNLQDGDRLYYLSRTSGLNLRTALEGNSFAELVMRNTTAYSLKADVFATADCEFDLNHPTFGDINPSNKNFVVDDPKSECDESKLLIRMADGTIRYRVINALDPSGLNAQATYFGTPGNDSMWGGVDTDTFWGNLGNDRIEGNDGGDLALGGEGDDIITDSHGDDILKGGDGNDAIDAGPGLDVVMSGNGKDFTNGGENANQTFAGEGDDFVIAGGGADTVFGGGGDDWLEGGGVNDLLQGDSGAPFFDDINDPGHDVLIGESGEDDYDAEGGDDIMVAGPGIERNHGARGFDWTIHKGDPQPGDSDLTIHINNAPGQLADRFLLTEALSGWKYNDVLKGDDWVPFEQDVELHAPWGSNALTDAGIDRISGLREILAGNTECRTDPQTPGDEGEGGPPSSGPPRTICGFGAGNILLGGSGSDTIQGRGANDVIDGDSWVNVRLSVRHDPADPATEYRTADSMRELEGDVFAGTLNPANIVIVREVLSDPNPTDVDTAVYGLQCTGLACTPGVRADYDITVNPNGSIRVHHARNLPGLLTDQGIPKGDATDTLWNVEQLKFGDGSVYSFAGPGAPVIGTATAAGNGALVTWTQPAQNLVFPISSFTVNILDTAGTVVGTRTAGPNASSLSVTGLAPGDYKFQVAANNEVGASVFSADSNVVSVVVDNTAPTVTARTPGIGSVGAGVAGDVTVTFSEPMDPAFVTAQSFRLRLTSGGGIPAVVTYDAASMTATLNPNATLAPGTSYTVNLQGSGGVGLRDLAGNRLVNSSWAFTTNARPTVNGRTPVANATGVSRGTNVTVTFSEAVTNVTGTTARLTRVSNGALVASVVTLSPNGLVLTINPNGNGTALLANTQYRVTLSGGNTGITDLAGVSLLATTWTFRTGS
jgi:Ca2+-binding RTX toxin-like protein